MRNAMRWRRETTHRAPKVFLPPPPHPLHPLSLPLTVHPQRQRAGNFVNRSHFSVGTVEGKRRGSGGAGAREKLLGPYVVLPRHRIAFRIQNESADLLPKSKTL